MYFYVKLTAESKKVGLKVSKSSPIPLWRHKWEIWANLGNLQKKARKKLFKSTYKNVLTHLHEEWTADSIWKKNQRPMTKRKGCSGCFRYFFWEKWLILKTRNQKVLKDCTLRRSTQNIRLLLKNSSFIRWKWIFG